MFRIASNLAVARSSLFRGTRIPIQTASISRGVPLFKYQKPQERAPCPPPLPPPPPPRKSRKLLWTLASVVLATGCFAVYAKTNPELRDWITLTWPWFDDLIAALHEENISYYEMAMKIMDDSKRAIVKYLKDDSPKKCIDGVPVQTVELPECTDDYDNDDEDEEEEGDYVLVKLKDYQDDEESPCCTLPPPILTKDVCEIERCLKDLGDTAILNYMTAKDACLYYNKLVLDTMANYTADGINEVRAAMPERLSIVKEALGYANAADSQLDDLTKYLDCGVQAPKDAIQNTKDLLKEYRDRIKTNKLQFVWENDRALAIDQLWQMMEEVLSKYKEENQTMFIGLDYESKKPVLNGDPDVLLYHTLRYVEKLKRELADAVAGMTERVNRGMESTTEKTCPQVPTQNAGVEASIKSLYAKKRAELDADYKRRTDDQKKANDKLLADSLRKQQEKHEENLRAKLEQKEAETLRKLNIAVAEQVETERRMMAKQLADMAATVKKVEDKLNAKLNAEKQTRRSQELWNAGASLLAATKKGDPYVRVDKEIKAIERARGDGEDKLVETVLKAIPNSVREKGIVPESVLRQKYRVMERTAMKVALVEQDGAPLPVYMLSLMQYFFLFMKIRGIPQQEFEKPPQEPFKDLDTFDLLQRARFWLDQGDLAIALRYIDSLQGASLAAAAAWRGAARDHLAARQAACAVIAHAAALGLQYI